MMCLGCLWLSFVVFCMEVDHINNSLCADEIEYLMINVTLKSNTAIETQAGFIKALLIFPTLNNPTPTY